jgi:HAD superfamily hydrolase (TIGR01549 family)
MIDADRQRQWVCFDVGETLIDETRVWSTWADVLGVPRFAFMAAIGATIARGEHHHATFNMVDRPAWRDQLDEFVVAYGGFSAADLYPDAVPALEAMRAAGNRVAIFANQPAERTAELRALGINPDLMAMSAEWGVQKPDPEFYARCLREMAAGAANVAYVGDRLDNDVLPAVAAGMRAVWLRRGPWAYIATDPPPRGTLVIDSLSELVERIDEVWR